MVISCRFTCISAFHFPGKGCVHLNKAVNFSAMKKGLAKQVFGECAVSYNCMPELRFRFSVKTVYLLLGCDFFF